MARLPETTRDLAAHFSELRELRLLVERSLGHLSFEINRARETGWAGETLDLCVQHSQTAMACWDQTLAALAAGPLATGSFEACFREGHLRSSTGKAGACSRCGGVLLVEEMRPASGFGARRAWTTCVACGPRACMESERLAIDVTAPDCTSPGDRVAIVVRLAEAEPCFKSQPRFLALHFRDKGSGRTIHACFEPFYGDEWVIGIDVPDDVTPDLHTLRVTVIHGMRIAHVRLQIACVPGPYASEPIVPARRSRE